MCAVNAERDDRCRIRETEVLTAEVLTAEKHEGDTRKAEMHKAEALITETLKVETPKAGTLKTETIKAAAQAKSVIDASSFSKEMTVPSRYPWMESALDQLHSKQRLRTLCETQWEASGYIHRGGRSLLNLASNHYLGFSPWLEPYMEQLQALCRSGGEPYVRMGSGASRLIAGHDPQHAALERELAEYMEREAALVFANGYMANIGIIQALVGRGDAVFSDRLNHASIVDGIQLSRAEHFRYSHLDYEQLERMLQRWRGAHPDRRALIVSDAVFSMDGTEARLEQLVKLKDRYDALLMLDEAHSIGVYGHGGRGLAYERGFHQQVDVVMGTLGKAFGLEGAFAAADHILIQYLVNRSRSFIYSTALPPIMAAMLRIRLREIEAADGLRERLKERVGCLRTLLQAGGLHTGEGASHIIPVLLGEDRIAVQASEQLQAAGIAGIAIRPPTVPENEARIRLTPMAIHTAQQIEEAAALIIKKVRTASS